MTSSFLLSENEQNNYLWYVLYGPNWALATMALNICRYKTFVVFKSVSILFKSAGEPNILEF